MKHLSDDELRVVHRLLEEVLHRFVVFNGMLLSEGDPTEAFTLDESLDIRRVELVMELLGIDRASDSALLPLSMEYAQIKERSPELARKIEAVVAMEQSRTKSADLSVRRAMRLQ